MVTLCVSSTRHIYLANSVSLSRALSLSPLELMRWIISLGNGLDKGACTPRPICGPPACRGGRQ